MKEKLLIISILLILTTSLFAQKGTTGATELLIPVSAKGLGLGGASISDISGLDALSYNPAGLSRIANKTEAMFSYMRYIADIQFSFASAAVSFDEFGVIALSARNLDFGQIPITTVEKPYGTGDTYSPAFMTFGLSYANSLGENLNYGLSLNLITEKIMQSKSTGFSFDFGFQYKAFAGLKGLDVGVALRNLGPAIKYDGADFITSISGNTPLEETRFLKYDAAESEIPLIIEPGISYSQMVDDNYGFSVAGSMTLSRYTYNEYKISAELSFLKMFYLRSGYAISAENSSDSDKYLWGPAFGAGINFNSGFNIIIDYAYRSVKFFEGNQMVSLRIGF